MSGAFSLIVILIPILLMTGLAIFFIRMFKKTSAADYRLVKEMASLEAMKRNAEWKEARIISVRAELPSRFDISNRILNLKLEIMNKDNKPQMYFARWRADTLILSSLQPDSMIQVKVHNDIVFPTLDGAKLYL